jgi:energy-coupling factor transporter ATP-binding protein EcfA2
VKTVEVENLGPIPRLKFALDDYGVHVIVASNGSGKSILLDAMSKLAKGGGRIPLKDGEKKGFIEGFGARLTITASARHTGEFEVSHLEGRFDLAELVDPGIAQPEAADRRRIRALASLSGAQPDMRLFLKHPAFAPTFSSVVSSDSSAKSDLVEMAEAVKRDYEKEARKQEDLAEQETGRAKALEEAIEFIDPHSECDAQVLQERYDKARDHRTRLTAKSEQATKAAVAAEKARQQLQEAQEKYAGPNVTAAEQAVLDAQQVRQEAQAALDEARKALISAEERMKAAKTVEFAAADKLCMAQAHHKFVEQCQKIIHAPVEPAPTEEELAQANQAVIQAGSAVNYGAVVRDAKDKAVLAESHRAKAKVCQEHAAGLRGAAGSIDEVLSGAIPAGPLKIASVDGKARLVVTHPARGENTPFHELSMGEKWRVAIDLAADQVGEGGLIVVEQAAWESLDSFVRPQIHQHAKERKVYVLTGEATRDPEDGSGFQVKPFETAVA